jgi:hypothetical protein
MNECPRREEQTPLIRQPAQCPEQRRCPAVISQPVEIKEICVRPLREFGEIIPRETAAAGFIDPGSIEGAADQDHQGHIGKDFTYGASATFIEPKR